MEQGYTIGLDIGTNSVGWAVIDESFRLAQGKKKIKENGIVRKSRTNLWGVRLFDAGVVAAEARSKRTQRRRLRRRKERLNYLRGIFQEEIFRVDDSFFLRLDESFYQISDKGNNKYRFRNQNGAVVTQRVLDEKIYKYPLFKYEKKEKEFYKRFPTIYHLRLYLMETNEKADIREIYLACHHILKRRGNFLNQGQKFDLTNLDVAVTLNETLKRYSNLAQINGEIICSDEEAANAVLTNTKLSNSKKSFDLAALFTTTGVEASELKKQLKALFDGIVGNKINLVKIFNNPAYTEKENDKISDKIYFSVENFEEIMSSLEEILTPDEIEVLAYAKKVYESIVLSKILNGHSSLSAAMVEKYNQHKQQLFDLKELAKGYPKLYTALFSEEGLYAQYIDGKGNPGKRLTLEDFYKGLKKVIQQELKVTLADADKVIDFSQTTFSLAEQQTLQTISEEINRENYLLKQRMYKNGAIPYQVHEEELVKIIEKQKVFYPFLGEKVSLKEENEEGHEFTKTEYKIQTLMKFKIPYYVGPLLAATQGDIGKKQSDYSRFAWMQKSSTEKITPWNFERVVDKEASAVEFIQRMTGFCTYFPEEKVLPKKSLLYQEFSVYNELITAGFFEVDFAGRKQKVYFNGPLRQEIVKNVFQKERKVTAEKVLHYLKQEKNIKAVDIFGIDKLAVNGKPAFNNSLSTFIDLTQDGIAPALIEGNKDKFEEIVKWQTVFEDKKSLRKTIQNANKIWQILSPEQIQKLAKRHYTGFGQLSQKLIDGIIDQQTGLTILGQLKQGDYDNFNRLVAGTTADRYSYKKQIEAAQTKQVNDERISYETIADLAGSPAIKKGIWQSILVIQELEKILGKKNIRRIVIEMSRENGVGRKTSRFKTLSNLYKNFLDPVKDDSVVAELKGFEGAENKLANEKYFLYFLQNGRCAYSGEPLNLDFISEYEVDHIIPQSILKDDSIDNKVLVKRDANQKKGGNVPSREIIRAQNSFWQVLVKAKLMSEKKYKSLTTGEITDKIREGFINRQLVENRQITKHVANILAKYFSDTETEILTPKSALTSQFRKGKLYEPNPEFNEVEAKKQGKNYGIARTIEYPLHEGFFKNREINDYHHAHDAFLNAVVANYLYLTKPELKNAWVYGSYQRNGKEVFGKWAKERKNKSLQLLNDMKEERWLNKETGEIIAYRDEVLTHIRKALSYRNVNIVKKVELLSGKFGDESIYKKDANAKNFANGLKNKLDPLKYGGTKAPQSACAVIVSTKKNPIKTVSISIMDYGEFGKSADKLKYLQALYPKEKITKIVKEKVLKYSKYRLANGAYRLVASYQEAKNGSQLPMIAIDRESTSEEELLNIFDEIASFIISQKLFTDSKIPLLKGIRDYFINHPNEVRSGILNDMLKVATGTNQGLDKLKSAGLGTSEQRLKSSNIIPSGSTLIYQSITGLFETRITLE